MSQQEGDHPEPFLISAATGSASAGSRNHTRGEAKAEEDVAAESATHGRGHRRNRGTLRRRPRRRFPPEEEGKQGETHSPRERGGTATQESKEDDDAPVAGPACSAPAASDDAAHGAGADGGQPPRRAPPPIAPRSGYIRKPDARLRDQFQNKLRGAADVPEVHFLGEVTEGRGFKEAYVSCKWCVPSRRMRQIHPAGAVSYFTGDALAARALPLSLRRRHLEWGQAWSFLAGDEAGQTQYAAADDGVHLWNHPLDVHLATASMRGWPRIVVQAWELDQYGRSLLAGYGFSHLPANPGYHELEVRCWRPGGSIREELQAFFLGTSPCLVDEEAIFGQAWETRSRLRTVSSGVVRLHVHVLSRHGVHA